MADSTCCKWLIPEEAVMAGSRWASDKVSNNNPTHGFEDQILYCSERRKYCLMTKSQSILLSCWITLCAIETWSFASVHAHRCLPFDNIEHFGICATPECFHVSQSGCCAICLSMDIWCIRHALSLALGSEIWILTWKKGKENPELQSFSEDCWYIAQYLSKILARL